MPFYADLSGLYGTSSSSYSAPYLSGPYSGHSSIIASNFTRPTASFGKPSPRGFSSGRNYKPHLATITESQLASRSIPRINPPSLLLHSSPKFKIQRPISINTADIDVSVNKYRKFERATKPTIPILKFDRKQPEREMVKPPSVVESATVVDDTNGGPFMPRIDSDTRSTIKRQRTVVRIHTDHNVSGNKDVEKSIMVLKPRWRENFDPSELSRSEKKLPVKTPGAKLMEKFLIKDTIREEDEDRIRNENEEKKRLREEKLKLYDDGKKHRRSVKRKQSIKKTPSFHDICRTISSDKINEDLNPVHTIMEQRRQSKIYCDEEILKQIRRNSAEILQEQVLMLDEMLRQQSEADAATKPEERSKKAHKESEATDEDKDSLEYGGRGSIKRKKKIVKKKSNEKIVLPLDEEEEVQSSLHRRPVHKKTRRSSTASSLDSVIEDSPYDRDTEQAYQDAIRDISQGEVPKIEVKSKSEAKNTEQKPLKVVVEEIQVQQAPKARRKLAINYSVEETNEKLKNIKIASDNVAKSKAENNDSSVLKRNLQNMLHDPDKSRSLRAEVENIGLVQNAQRKDVVASDVVQIQPFSGRKGEMLQEKVLPAKKVDAKKEKLVSPTATNGEVNNNNVSLSNVQKNTMQINEVDCSGSQLKQKLDGKTNRKHNDLVIVKDAGSKLSGRPEALENLAKVKDVDKPSPSIPLSKSKSLKALEVCKLNEAANEAVNVDVEPHQCVAKVSQQNKKLEPNSVSERTSSSGLIESADLYKVETKNANKVSDIKGVGSQMKPLGTDKMKLPEKQLTKQRKFAAKTKPEQENDDGEFDFWSSIDPEENVNKTREHLKAEQEKWQANKWDQEAQRLEECERKKVEEEKRKLQLIEEEKRKLKVEAEEKRRKKNAEEEARKLKLAQEEERRKQRQKEEEELKRRRAELEEQKRKLAEESEKRRQKLAEEERQRNQKLVEEEEAKRKVKQNEEERKQAEEEKRKQKLAEEEESRKRQLSEVEKTRKRILQEEEKKKQELAEKEESKKRQLAEEEAVRKQKLAEEEKRIKKLAEDAKKKEKQLEEEKRKQKLAEEAEKRKQKIAEEEQKRKQRQKEEEEKKLKEKLLHEEKVKRKRLQDEIKNQKLLEEGRKRKQQAEEEEANRKQKELEEEEQFRQDAEIEAERIRAEEHKRMVSKRSIVSKYNTVQDPDLEIFQVPEEPVEEEPRAEETTGGFVPLQSNRLSQFMLPFQKPEHYDECPVVIMATPKDIRKRHYPRPRISRAPTPSPPPPQPPPPPPANEEPEGEEEEDDDADDDDGDDDDETEEGSSSDDGSSSTEEEYAVERSGTDIGKSTSSTDSGFDSSAPGSPANRRHNG